MYDIQHHFLSRDFPAEKSKETAHFKTTALHLLTWHKSYGTEASRTTAQLTRVIHHHDLADDLRVKRKK